MVVSRGFFTYLFQIFIYHIHTLKQVIHLVRSYVNGKLKISSFAAHLFSIFTVFFVNEHHR
jgi:hypothetical protein